MEHVHRNLIGYLIYDAQRSVAKSLEVTLLPYDITPGQWNLINQLAAAGELSQKDLAQRAKKEPATITRFLDALERKDLIVRNRHKTDRRSYMISITDKAHRLLDEVMPKALQAADQLVGGIDPDTVELFVKTLAAIQKNADAIALSED